VPCRSATRTGVGRQHRGTGGYTNHCQPCGHTLHDPTSVTHGWVSMGGPTRGISSVSPAKILRTTNHPVGDLGMAPSSWNTTR
jgi:hypothetical protein